MEPANVLPETAKANQAQHLDEQFRREYAKLNAAQRQAVDALQGPVLVVAGPGTGKTQMLALRVAHLLRSDLGVQPHEVLCLTFTNAGRTAMQQRLQQLAGPVGAQVPVHTFHSFCSQVLADHPEYFNEGRRLLLASDLELELLLRRLIDELPTENPLRRLRGNLYYETTRLGKLFSTLKTEGWYPEELLAEIADYEREIPTLKAFIHTRNNAYGKKDELKATGRKELEDLKLTRAAVQCFPRWLQLLQQAGRYTYDDLLLWVNNALAQEPDLNALLRERYQYVLVDEFQDTNGAQLQLIHHLTDDPDGQPNLFVVGDDDQAIYRFQGANVGNLAQLAERYAQHLRIISLTENYRSTQAILRFAAAVIAPNRERIQHHPELHKRFPGLEKTLVARGNAASVAEYGPPTVVQYSTPLAESLGVYRQVQALLAAGTAPSAIAILYRKHRQAHELFEVFQAKDVAATLAAQQDALQLPAFQQYFRLLQYLYRELQRPGSGDPLLFAMLYYTCWGLNPRTVLYIGLVYNSRRLARQRERAEAGNDAPLPYQSVLNIVEELARTDDPDAERLQHLVERLHRWRGLLLNLGLLPFLRTVLSESGMLAQMANRPDALLHLQAVQRLFSFAEEEAQRQAWNRRAEHDTRPATTDLSLHELLAVLEQMQELGIRLSYRAQLGQPQGVQFLSAHGAKGLEFEHVFVIGTDEKAWKPRTERESYTLPPHRVRSNQASKEQLLEDERRLFYVACTRAKLQLHISYPATDDGDTPQLPATILTELADAGAYTLQEVRASATDAHEAVDFLVGLMAQPPLELGLAECEQLLQELRLQYVLSVSGLGTWQDCRRRFFYEQLLRLPADRTVPQVHGDVAHQALRRFFELVRQMNVVPPYDRLREYYHEELNRQRGEFSEAQYVAYQAWEAEYLQPFYDRRSPTWETTATTEVSVNAFWRGIPLTGKLDRLDRPTDGGLRIVDYKTGTLKSGADSLKPPYPLREIGPRHKPFDPNQPDHVNGGALWQQALFYALLLQQSKHYGQLPAEAVFEFLGTEPGDNATAHINILPAGLEHLTSQIETAWAELQQLTYHQVLHAHGPTHGMCGTCAWCQLARTKVL